MKLDENLHGGDLKHLVKKVFDIDSHKSKIGEDEDLCVLSFTVDSEDPAKDLENFIEMGFKYVLDADTTPGELDDGKYRVFVEIERTRKIAKQIFEIVEGVKKISGLEDMRFRYFKSFKSQDATLENLENAVPTDSNSYEIATERYKLDNFTEFFSRSFSDTPIVIDESITFTRPFSGSVTFEILDSGNKDYIHNSIKGPVLLESKDMAEVMFLTKIIGNYNIIKVADTFIFENNGWAVALKRLK
jgi:hypothetical protein